MNEELLSKLETFVDALELEYGDLTGFKVVLDHPIVDGQRQEHATIKEIVLFEIKETSIDLTNN